MTVRKTYLIHEGSNNEGTIQFTLTTAPEGQWQPANRVITDSDEMAFIYVIDENDAFSYFVFQQSSWDALVQMIQQEQDPAVVIGEEAITLTGMFEELQALLFNIEGNSNYGEAFVTAVEEAFSAILAEA